MHSKNSIINLLTILVICCSALGFSFYPAQPVLAASDSPGVNTEAVPQANLLEGEVTLSGHVYQEDGVTPIEGAIVTINTADNSVREVVNSDSSGYYEILLAPAEYFVSVSASGYGKEYYDNTYDSLNAAAVTVDPDTGASGIDFSLFPEALVTGYVFESDGITPISGASVSLEPVSGGEGLFATSGTDGSYTVTNVSSGTYYAYVWASGYFGEYYLDGSYWGSGTELNVTQPNTTTGINFTLERVVTLSGYVYEADGITPISNAWVKAYDEAFNFANNMFTNSEGYYEIQLAPGKYYLSVSAGGYGGVYYPNAYDRLNATLVSAETETSVSGVNFTLSPEAIVSGFVYENDGTTPISNAEIEVWPSSGGNSNYATSGIDGSYSLHGLASGNYYAKVQADGFIPEYYLNASSLETATEIVVSQPNELSGINFTLGLAGAITGYIFDSNGQVITDSSIRVHAIGVSPGSSRVGTYASQVDGSYSISGLAQGTYQIVANYYNDPNYEKKYFENQIYIGTADLVEFTPGQVSGPYNFILYPKSHNPVIIVRPDYDLVQGNGWKPSTAITITIGSTTLTTSSDSSGNFYYNDVPVDLVPGMEIVVSDQANAVTKTTVVKSLSIDTINLADDEISGSAAEGSKVNISACDSDHNCYRKQVFADSSGFWAANFSDYPVDIVFGSSGNVGQADEDGDVTELYWEKYLPHIQVLPQTDEVRGFNFKPITTVYLKIGSYTASQMSNSRGSVFFETGGFDVAPGQLVEMNDGDIFVETLVKAFTIDSVDLEGDSLSGTAEPFSSLAVFAYRNSSYLGEIYPMVTADADGNWVAVFPDAIDLLPGDYGWVSHYDENGHNTQLNWDTPTEGSVSVTGHVYQADGSTPIANAHVRALDGNFREVNRGEGYTKADGSFEIWVQPGQYYLAITAIGYGGVYYENGYDDPSAILVTAEEGTGASGIDFILSPEATISGYVYENDGVTPISGAQVHAYPDNGGQMVEALSSPDGSYTIQGLSSGNFRAYASATGFAPENFSTSISVTQPNNTPNINFALDRAYPISGHVYQEDGVTPITGGYISFRNQYFNSVGSTQIQEDGFYIAYLPEGQYYVATVWTEGFGGEMYDNACGGTTATQVTVGAPDGVSGIDFQLGPEASISGYVYESDGVTPASNGWIYIKPAGDGVRFYAGTTDEGYYEVNGLCSGNYIISAGADGYEREYYQDKATEAEATPVTLTQPNMTSDINFILGDPSYSISGTVTLSDGITPLAGVTVRYDSTHSAITDAGGEFLFLNVAPGNYTLTPTKNGFVFDPANILIELGDASSSDNLFTAYAIPSSFAKTSPVSASINKELEVTLSWGTSTGAEYYEYCIDKTNDNTCSAWVDVGSETSVAVSDLDYQTKYYWQVRAWNGPAGPVYANGAATSYWNFTTKKLLVTTPPENVTASDGTFLDKVVVTWEPLFGATSYKIFRAAAPTGTQTLLGSTTSLVYNNAPAAGIKYYYFVQGCNANGCGPKSAYELGWRTAATITARPVLTLPVNGAFLDDREVSFTWEFVPGATGYEIQVDTNTYFAAPLTTTWTTGEAILAYLATMPNDGKFYWRVRGLGEGGLVGPWSAAWAFTVDTLDPPVPNLYRPIANGVTYDTTPALSVTAVTGAKYYRFQVAETDTFDDILFDSTVTTTAVSSTALAYKSGYYWRAKAIDAAGNESDWSAPRFMTITPQKTPLPGAFTTDLTPTFTWYAVSGASAYELTVTRVDAIQDPYIKELGVVLSNTPVTALPVGRYEWVIKAKVGDSWVESPLRSLTITPPLLKAPLLVNPAAGAATNDGMPTLEWSPVVDAAKYEIWIDNGTGFTSREYEAVVDGAETLHELVSSLPADGRYYWKMRTINYLDVAGPWSAYRALVFDTLAPAAPKLYAPADYAPFRGTPTFTWLAVTGGKYYQFEITSSSDPGFTSSFHLSADTIATTSYKPPLLPPDDYFWRVRARDLAGNWSVWSAVRFINISPAVPAAPVLVSPSTGTISADNTPTFTWNPVGYGVKYQIQLSKSLYFTTIDYQNTISATEFKVTPITAGTYYWRVKAANEVDQWSAWSAKRKIIIP